ncbi:MAG TPA: peroxiredoxin family protein [Nocardioidaceae bacterium]
MTTKADRRAELERREHLNEIRREAAARERRQRHARVAAWLVGLAVVAAVVVTMGLTSRPESSSATRTAPDFTLTDTAGKQVHLASLRGQNVLLYFSEGAGCQSCLVQMAEIEKDGRFAKAGLNVLPIVMNTRAQIMKDMAANGVSTPFLLDDGTVSRAYGTLGKGMHAGLPGHSFVLIDKSGMQRWYGEYPSMWLSPTDLITQIDKHLRS